MWIDEGGTEAKVRATGCKSPGWPLYLTAWFTALRWPPLPSTGRKWVDGVEIISSPLIRWGGEGGGINKSALLDCVEYLPTWNFLISPESKRVQLTMRSKEAVNHFDQVLSFPLGSSQRRWLGGMEWIFWWSLLSFPGEWFNAADPFNYSWKLKLVHLHLNMDSAV